MKIKKEITARKNILRKSKEVRGLDVKGYDFNRGINYSEIIKSFKTTGAQSSNLAEAIEIIREMRRKKAKIYLGYTSNLVTSGLRDIFRYLAEKKLIDVIVTTAGGIEEDIIKCLGPFKIGDFNLEGKKLRNMGIKG